MASKKKQRRAQQRQQKQNQSSQSHAQSTHAEDPQAKAQEAEENGPRGPLASTDRALTLIGFGVLIVFVIVIAPYFAHKQDRDFEQSAQKVLQALQNPDESETLKVLPAEALKPLRDLKAYPLDSVSEPFFQGGAKQASVRTAFQAGERQGLLSIAFLLKQELSLDSRWHPVSFCRPDQTGARVAQDFLTALRAGDYTKAYGLSAASVADLDKGISEAAFTEEAKTWLQTHQAVLQPWPADANVPLPQVEAEEATLRAVWPEPVGDAKPLSLLLLENPLQCAYVVHFTLQ